MQIIKTTDNKQLRICGSAYACVLYDKTFSTDLPKDWGIVEGAVNNFLKHQEVYKRANEAYVSACNDLNLDPYSPDSINKLVEANVDVAEILIKTLEDTKESLNQNYDLQMTKFLQIVFILNMAQELKDGGKETTFEDWLINNDIRLFEVWDGVFEEIKNVFSSGSQE